MPSVASEDSQAEGSLADDVDAVTAVLRRRGRTDDEIDRIRRWVEAYPPLTQHQREVLAAFGAATEDAALDEQRSA